MRQRLVFPTIQYCTFKRFSSEKPEEIWFQVIRSGRHIADGVFVGERRLELYEPMELVSNDMQLSFFRTDWSDKGCADELHEEWLKFYLDMIYDKGFKKTRKYWEKNEYNNHALWSERYSK